MINQVDLLENIILPIDRLFVDTCSLMHEKASQFFQNLKHVLKNNKRKIYITKSVLFEIEKLSKNSNSLTNVFARQGKDILVDFHRNELLEVYGEESDTFADNVFIYVFAKFRIKYNLGLITQDVSLAQEINSLNDSKAVTTKYKISLLKLNGNGSVSVMFLNQPLCSNFEIPRIDNNKLLKVTSMPQIGDKVKSDSFGSVSLLKNIGEGGEGFIYETNSGHACKIFRKDRLTELRFQKIGLLTSHNINIPGVCWPLSPVYNLKNDFVGYIMELATGNPSPMQKCMFVKQLLEKYFPDWTRRNLVQVAITLLEKIVLLHKMNIIIGDVNPLNFLIKSDKEIYFVDVDSYQIEDFPCPVGMVNFTAPEIQSMDYGKFLRKTEHENFAIATILFMILMPGKPPYSHQGGGDPSENIKGMDFSYPLGKLGNKKAPDGPWRFIWSHFPYEIKKAFYNCFKKGDRPNSSEWLQYMKSYLYYLEMGYADSEEGYKIFPSNYKPLNEYAKKKFNKNMNTVGSYDYDKKNEKINSSYFENYDKCNICGSYYKYDYNSNYTCDDCRMRLSKTLDYTLKCNYCGNKFKVNYRDYNEMIKQRFKVCPTCE